MASTDLSSPSGWGMSPWTTQMYLHADLRLKEQALARLSPLGIKPSRYRPDDHLLAFLESL